MPSAANSGWRPISRKQPQLTRSPNRRIDPTPYPSASYFPSPPQAVPDRGSSLQESIVIRLRYLLRPLTILLSACVVATAAGRHVLTTGNWKTDADQAWQSAQQDQRLMLLFITTQNCLYCRKMEHDTFADQKVAGHSAKLRPRERRGGKERPWSRSSGSTPIPRPSSFPPRAVWSITWSGMWDRTNSIADSIRRRGKATFPLRRRGGGRPAERNVHGGKRVPSHTGAQAWLPTMNGCSRC